MMMKSIVRKFFILLNSVLLTGCAVKLPLMTNYMLDSIPNDVPQRRPHHLSILVMPPDADPVYNTVQMVYVPKPLQVAYFSKNQWAEIPSQMLQPLLTQTLRNTHFFQAVISPPALGRYDYVLNTQILKLDEDLTQNPRTYRISMRAQLTRYASNTVVGMKEFTVEVPILQCCPYAAVIAANKATAIILGQIAAFTVHRL